MSMDCDADCKQQPQRQQKSTVELMSSVLSRAFLEWILMILLYINALFSFLVTQFARVCKLQTPCLLCSRLDHIILPGPVHYNDLICHSHKKKISDITCVEKKNNSTLKQCYRSAPFEFKPTPPPQASTVDSSINDDDKRMIVKKAFVYCDSDNLPEDNIDEKHEERRLDEKPEERIPHESMKPEPVSLMLPAGDAIVDSTSDSETVSKGKFESIDDKLTNFGNLIARTSTSDPEALTIQTTRDMGSNLDLNDAYKLAIGSKSSNVPSPTVAQVLTARDSSKVYEDLRLLVSQFSAARGLESPWAELSSPSPRVLHDPSNNAILEHITKSLSVDRNESGLENLNHSSSIVTEIEGESVVDRLKRQVELDRKSIYLLYKELEEERNASAVAAYQAMAMITRLQEEKASMHMEALQYQRMMEEQSEYDQEAILKSNQVVHQREKEIQDLQAQLAYFRKMVGDDFVLDKFEKGDV